MNLVDIAAAAESKTQVVQANSMLVKPIVSVCIAGAADRDGGFAADPVLDLIVVEHDGHFKQSQQRTIKRFALIELTDRQLNMRDAADLHTPAAADHECSADVN